MGMTRVYDALMGREVDHVVVTEAGFHELVVSLHGQSHVLYPGMRFADDVYKAIRLAGGSSGLLVGHKVFLIEHEEYPYRKRLTIAKELP